MGRLTQEFAEVGESLTGEGRLTQAFGEVGETLTGEGRLSQVLAEVGETFVGEGRLSQVFVEVAVQYNATGVTINQGETAQGSMDENGNATTQGDSFDIQGESVQGY